MRVGKLGLISVSSNLDYVNATNDVSKFLVIYFNKIFHIKIYSQNYISNRIVLLFNTSKKVPIWLYLATLERGAVNLS